MNRISRLISVLANCAALMMLIACQCTYTVSPASAPAVASGVTIPVNVTASSSTCAWQYQGNDPWITVGPDPDNTGQTGKGNGRVLVTVAANQGASARTGTATIAGHTVTINQAASSASGCTLQVTPASQTFNGGTAGTGTFTITASTVNCGWRAARSSNLEDTVNLTSGGSGGTAEERFGTGTATIGYQVKAKSATSPWPAGGGDIVVRDSANQEAGRHHVDLQ
jgi:all-beta uncharacterized protein